MGEPQYSFQDDDRYPALVLVIDGKTLAFALEKELRRKFVKLARRCRSVLCCRATPLQKGEIVKLIRDTLHVMTLAVGDGANDVSMIQVADVGVGISGQEGMQAVMSSDYAIAQFRFLRKLLLVHGHWNYARLASMVLYFFYKNAAFVFLIFWFQFLCGFSGGNMIEQMYLILFNLTITGLPPLINGVLDKDVGQETLLRKPELYKQGINDEVYKPRTFWINLLDALYQSLVIFWFLYFAYMDSDVGLIEWGTGVTTAIVFTVLAHLAIETKTWTWLHWSSHLFSILVLFFAFFLIYNIVCPACLPPSNPYYVMERVIQTGLYWFSFLLATIVALLPRYLVRCIQTVYFPTACQRERMYETMDPVKKRKMSSPQIHLSTDLQRKSPPKASYMNPAFHNNTPPASNTPEVAFSKPNSPPPRSKMNLDLPKPATIGDLIRCESTPDMSPSSPFKGLRSTLSGRTPQASQNANFNNNAAFMKDFELRQYSREPQNTTPQIPDYRASSAYLSLTDDEDPQMKQIAQMMTSEGHDDIIMTSSETTNNTNTVRRRPTTASGAAGGHSSPHRVTPTPPPAIFIRSASEVITKSGKSREPAPTDPERGGPVAPTEAWDTDETSQSNSVVVNEVLI